MSVLPKGGSNESGDTNAFVVPIKKTGSLPYGSCNDRLGVFKKIGEGSERWVAVRVQAEGAVARKWQDYIAFFGCFFGSAVFLWVLFPWLYQHGAMWAESANNYFSHAYLHTTAQNLVALDFGYVPLFVRLCAMLVGALGVPPVWVPAVYAWITMGCIAGCVAAFALPVFRSFINSDWARVLVCVGLLAAPGFPTKSFINFPYYGAIVFYLWLVWATRQKQLGYRQACVGGLFLAVLCLSKPHFLSFVPA